MDLVTGEGRFPSSRGLVDDEFLDPAGLGDEEIVKLAQERPAETMLPGVASGPFLDDRYPMWLHHRYRMLTLIECDLRTASYAFSQRVQQFLFDSVKP